jgi:sec-independent protein translocase protein TatA
MFGLGLGELLVILVVVLILFGSSKLPQLGQGLGEGIKSFRKAFRDVSGDEKKDDGPKPPPAK